MSNKFTTKPHFQTLDGLRGVAALLVVWYHINEGFGFASFTNKVSDGTILDFNHGYLAVDFFFILSGFVISYAYDDRWKDGLDIKTFFLRRIIRLHPMVVFGSVIGLICYLIQGGTTWDGNHPAPILIAFSFLFSIFLIPIPASSKLDVRGNGEMFPFNGPGWSLFFEYIGNILYALSIRKCSNRVLLANIFIVGTVLAMFTIGDFANMGSLSVGWTLDLYNFTGGIFRMLFPYLLGMYLSRIYHSTQIKGAFVTSSLVLTLLFSVPFLSPVSGINLNGIFELLCIVIIFPIIVWIGASENIRNTKQLKVIKLLGDLSYPLYLTHYPIMYLFYKWLIDNSIYSFKDCPLISITAYVLSVIIAYITLKIYDIPIRRKLSSLLKT